MKRLKVIALEGRDVPGVGARAYGEYYIIGQDIDEEKAVALSQTAFFILEDDEPAKPAPKASKKEEVSNE